MSGSLPLMRFKTFVWPNNPKTIEVVQEAVDSKAEGFLRIVRGQGEFFGHSAVKSYRALSDLLQDKTSGGLYLPGIGYFEAVFKGVSLMGEPGPYVLRYAFEFQEVARSFGGEADKKHYEAESDTSLWGIANAFDVKTELLVELNPQIKNPSFVKAGTKVRIR